MRASSACDLLHGTRWTAWAEGPSITGGACRQTSSMLSRQACSGSAACAHLLTEGIQVLSSDSSDASESGWERSVLLFKVHRGHTHYPPAKGKYDCGSHYIFQSELYTE